MQSIDRAEGRHLFFFVCFVFDFRRHHRRRRAQLQTPELSGCNDLPLKGQRKQPGLEIIGWRAWLNGLGIIPQRVRLLKLEITQITLGSYLRPFFVLGSIN